MVARGIGAMIFAALSVLVLMLQIPGAWDIFDIAAGIHASATLVILFWRG